MHPIKREIVQNLIMGSAQRFNQLKPADIESNHFIYYLKQLMAEGLVEKQGQTYTLTEHGKHMAGRFSLRDLTVRLQPKIVTTPVCIEDDQVLLYRWRREPGFGQVSLVNGKLHFGESVVEAGNRELKEKTNLKAQLTHVGTVYIREFQQGQCNKHLLSHILSGADVTGDLRATDVGEPFWADKKELGNLNLLPGTQEILNCMDQPPVFFREFTFEGTAT